MSLESWKKEFYPSPADLVEEKDALAHSMQKWRGLLPGNLKRHDCKIDGRHVAGEGVSAHGGKGEVYFSVDAFSCGLCHHFYEPKGDEDDNCERCPLFLVRGGVPCDNERDDEEESPYGEFTENGNPRPMVKWLNKAAGKAAMLESQDDDSLGQPDSA